MYKKSTITSRSGRGGDATKSGHVVLKICVFGNLNQNIPKRALTALSHCTIRGTQCQWKRGRLLV